MNKMRMGSLFAGAGGIDLGFEQTLQFKTVYANEFNDKAAETFNLNHEIEIDQRDIREGDPTTIPDFDVLLAGFPLCYN